MWSCSARTSPHPSLSYPDLHTLFPFTKVFGSPASSVPDWRLAAALCREEVEKVPLRHERDELGTRRQMREICEGRLKVTEATAQAIRLGVWALQKLVVEAELVQDFQGRRVDSVAAKVAQEVCVPLQHHHGYAGTRHQEPRHHSRRTAADDAARYLALDVLNPKL